jgi:hypothetical protein
MRGIRLQRISPAMVVATVALIVPLSQTAFAGPVAQLAKLVRGDKVIKRHSLSGNRLRNHTLTGTQINLAKLGTVPAASRATDATNASRANSADTATNATNATNAVHANTAGDASTLQGNDASAFMHGNGQVIVGRRDLNNATPSTTLVDVPGVGTVTTDCISGTGSLEFTNHSGSTEDVSVAFNYGAPQVSAAADGNKGGIAGLSADQTVVWEVATRASTPKITTIVATYSTHGPTTCTTFAQATSAT